MVSLWDCVLLELGEIPSPTNKVQTLGFLSNNDQALLVITTKSVADAAGMQRQFL